MASQVSNYLNDLKRYNRRDNTLRIASFTLQKAEKEIGKNLLEVDNDEIESWVLSIDISPNSRLEYLSRLDQFYKWGIRKEHILKNPIGDMMQVIKRNPTKTHPPLNPQQVRTLIISLGDLRRIIVLLLAYKTGMRRNELYNLEVGEEIIDMDNQKINIKERKGGKTGKYVFFDDETKNYLQAYLMLRKPKNPKEKALFLDSHGYKITTQETLAKIASDAGKIAGFPEVTMHSFRHFFTSHLNANRCHPKVIQILRGDSNRSMVEYYTEFTEEQVKAEYLKCIPSLNLPRLNIPEPSK